VVGIRFRPGAAPPMLGVPASELRDLRVPLTEVWDSAGRVEEALEEARSAPARLGVLAAELRRRLPGVERPDGLVAEAVRRLRGPTPERVGAIGDELGISERQLRRRFHAAVGYGPKTLARVLRFRRLLGLAARRPPSNGDLARLALDAGYADQAHMTAECTRLGGAPPASLLATL
jgi:methylphosphotriester-DNA--protein-cysteine methyltransferase